MLYLSQLLGMPVEDSHNVRVGKVIDVLVPAAQMEQKDVCYPGALLVEGEEDQPWRIPLDMVEHHGNLFHLQISLEQLKLQASSSVGEVYLARDVLDKQIIDIVHKKAVRVNNVCFDEDWRILGIDTSIFGLLRRLAPSWLPGAGKRNISTTLIPWEQLELVEVRHPDELPVGGHVSARPQSGHLAELHPADIAEIVYQLAPGQGARLIEGLDDETAADTMEEIDTNRQRHILESIPAERVADILQAMGPDEVADLLSQMPEERAQELLRLMSPEESEDVQELLAYEADTAGGLMTTDYIVLNQTRTVVDALESMRTHIQEKDVRIAYIYCVADETSNECRVLGVVSLWDLLVASPTQTLQELMETDVIAVQPESDAHAVAQTMAKYNLLAVPVVNKEGVLEGVVTVDDALDVLLPPDRRRKSIGVY